MRLAILSVMMVAMMASGSPAYAQTGEIQKKVTDALAQEKAKAVDAKSNAAQKTYTFEMHRKPWSAVVEWLTDKTGKPYVGSAGPAGTFDFAPPKDSKFTIPEIIDII